MGILGAWIYGLDLDSAIETAETCIAKIKSNKFDKKEIEKVKKSLEEVIKELDKAINEQD